MTIVILQRKQLERPPSLEYRAAHDNGNRVRSQIRHIVLHSTESDTAASAARWLSQTESNGSAHLVVDDASAYRLFGDLTIPWGAPPLNTTGLHIEQAGHAAWAKARWLMHIKTIQRAAYQSARWCDTYKIEPRWLTVDELRSDLQRSGITSHSNVSKAFGKTDHSDPGRGYPVSTFLWFLNRYLK